MIFRQLFDSTSSTYTYLLGCEATREAVIIDPVFEQFDRDTALIRELGLTLRYVCDTHVHADHVTAAWLMQQRLGAQVVLAAENHATGVDLPVRHEDELSFGHERLTVLATPGHTAGCITFVTSDRLMAFTGDCLLIRGAGRTDFQSGDVHAMWQSIRTQIFNLPDNCQVFPAHDYMGRSMSTVAEEKRFNPRIGGDAKEEDFAGYMENLALPHPKLLDIAVPANMVSGRPADGKKPEPDNWAPLTLTFAGVPEIDPDWLARHRETVFILDVRSSSEYLGELGHIDSSVLIPLDELRARLDEVPRDRPVVAVCQSGKRSAMATQILRNAGIQQVANVPGGMIQWRRLALP